MTISPDKMAIYKATARKRALEDQQQLATRYKAAQKVARAAAGLLKRDYSATHVAMFGSLVHPNLFHGRSDIDLAVWGLDERDYYRAVGRLQAVDPAFAIDLVRVEEVSGTLRDTIEQESEPL